MSSDPLKRLAAGIGRPTRPRSGLNFLVSGTLAEVEEAWSLVYQAYLRDDLIDPNPHGVHTTVQAVGPQTAVILGCLGPLLVGTLSIYADGPGGLPLDSVYHAEIEALRQSGRRVMEVGLFADRREHMNRSAEGLFELMRYAYYFAVHLKVDDAIIGVHPRHAPFYMRLLGFDKVGAVRSYPTVRDRAVVLMRCRVKETAGGQSVPKGLAYFIANAIDPDVFARRFRFDDAQIGNSRLGRFLRDKQAGLASVA